MGQVFKASETSTLERLEALNKRRSGLSQRIQKGGQQQHQQATCNGDQAHKPRRAHPSGAAPVGRLAARVRPPPPLARCRCSRRRHAPAFRLPAPRPARRHGASRRLRPPPRPVRRQGRHGPVVFHRSTVHEQRKRGTATTAAPAAASHRRHGRTRRHRRRACRSSTLPSEKARCEGAGSRRPPSRAFPPPSRDGGSPRKPRRPPHRTRPCIAPPIHPCSRRLSDAADSAAVRVARSTARQIDVDAHSHCYCYCTLRSAIPYAILQILERMLFRQTLTKLICPLSKKRRTLVTLRSFFR